MARLDAWLWAVRLYKTRSNATAGVRGGHVRVNDKVAKAAQIVVTGDLIRVRREGEERVVEVLDPNLVKRVGAAVAQQAYLDKTPPKPEPVAGMGGKVAVRDRGAGRPTKKERRDMDAFRGRRG
ncbi:MAG: S4 domain-containing protein [Propioniciclava sp.]|uniref:RNA-binding S4 domain-containing protein n=1 Tax=Propioniciclava sp. TaxID=2038686 RepID=UPI0039E44E1D